MYYQLDMMQQCQGKPSKGNVSFTKKVQKQLKMLFRKYLVPIVVWCLIIILCDNRGNAAGIGDMTFRL